MPKIRLFVDVRLAPGQVVALDGSANYLVNVMRRGEGDLVALFNGRDGEWRARLSGATRRAVSAQCEEQIAPQVDPPDVWLMFAPIKKTRTDFIVEKAAELGARRICPVLTRYTNAERVRVDRLTAHAVEAAEQCGGTFVPKVCAPRKLADVLADWPQDRRLMFCDEARTALPVATALAATKEGAGAGPWAILIGPEGGFSPEEAEALRARPETLPVTLGPRVLRADTAAVAALTAWQSALGDWT